jgi:dihydrolipoamide dehydrogenase
MGKSLFKPSILKGRLSCRTSMSGEYQDILF